MTGRRRGWPALCLLLVPLLVACAPGGATPTPPMDDLAVTPSLTLESPPQAIEEESAAPTGSPGALASAPLAGPLLGFYIEDTYEDHYFAVFDTGTGAFREFYVLRISPGEARWFADGCRVFAHGQLLDLQGQTRWTLPPEVVTQIGDISGARLSPGLNWLGYPVASGEAGRLDIAVIGLAAPFARIRLTERGGASPTALLWSPDEAWLYFSDYDPSGLPQLYRAHPDGSAREQLTDLSEPAGQFNALALSPDGRRLAYGARTLLQPRQPYEYDPANEGWVGIVDLDSGATVRARLPKFGAVENERGLVWDMAGERLLVIGDSLPIAHDDPLAGRQIHWLTAGGEVTRSFYQADGPSGQVGWVAPLGNIDTLMFSSNVDYYLYEDGALRRLEGAAVPPLGMEIGRRPIGVLPAPLGFPGEAGCAP